MGSRAFLLAAVCASGMLLLPAAASPLGASPTASVRPVADGYVTRSAPKASFGKAHTLRIAARPATRAYLRFRVNVAQGVDRATLRVYATGGRGRVQARAVVPKSWNERSLDYVKAPRVGATVSSASLSPGWKNLDVTPLVGPSGLVDIALSGTGGGAVASREAGAKSPRLVVLTATTMLAAGDIADCSAKGDTMTAAIIEKIP